MSFFRSIRDAFHRDVQKTTKTTVATQGVNNQITLSALCDAYGNLFAQVRPLVDEMITVEPYGVGRNGASLPMARTPELVTLRNPNKDMGGEEFMDAMFTTWLTEDELLVRVWKRGNGKIYGYSLIPPGSRQVAYNGEETFRFTENGEYLTLTRDEVLVLRYSRSPRDYDKGVSPASSVFTWTQVDDLMAQFQRAFIENGAIPASITFIRASTKEKFVEAKNELESQLKGPENRNKTLYVWRAFDNRSGMDVDQVEIKTVQGPNSTLAIKEIMSIINDKINKAFGVSNFILGDDSSAKYDNAELSDLQFTKRRVYPALRKFWSEFQHELDRVTGGLGYAIQFDLDVPELTDRLKTRAETAKIHAETLTSLINGGAMPSAAVSALELSDEWLHVADGIYRRAFSSGGATTTNFTLENKQANTLGHPRSVKASKKTGDATPSSITWEEGETRARQIYGQLMRIAEAIAKDMSLPTEEVIDAITDLLTDEANDGANAGAEHIVGYDLQTAVKGEIKAILDGDGYHVSPEFTERIKERTTTLLDRFTSDTKDKVANVLSTSRKKELSAEEIEEELSKIMPNARAQIIARNETVFAFRAGRLANDEYLAKKYDLKIKKVWRTSGDSDVCPVCAEMNGKTVGLRDAFPEEASHDHAWTHSSWNLDGEIPQAHVNCRCYYDEEVIL